LQVYNGDGDPIRDENRNLKMSRPLIEAA